jgi:anthraniloyl-CoA monooxygenase
MSTVSECSDARVVARLSHAGRRGACKPRRIGIDMPLRDGAWELIAPSPLAFAPGASVPREMDQADVDRIKAAFVGATLHAATAGFHALMLDMAHGYLLSSFLSPLTNRRKDEYGGSPEARLRFPLEVFDAVRAAWDERPLLVALNGSDRARGGLALDDAVAIARCLRERGCDMIAVYAGQVTPRERYDYDPASLGQLSDVIRNEARIPTLATGYMDTSNQPNTLLASGRADLCMIQPPN